MRLGKKEISELKGAKDPPRWKNISESKIRILSSPGKHVVFIVLIVLWKFLQKSQDNYFNAISNIDCYEGG